jgi:hypothetical protein
MGISIGPSSKVTLTPGITPTLSSSYSQRGSFASRGHRGDSCERCAGEEHLLQIAGNVAIGAGAHMEALSCARLTLCSLLAPSTAASMRRRLLTPDGDDHASFYVPWVKQVCGDEDTISKESLTIGTFHLVVLRSPRTRPFLPTQRL